MLDRRSPAYRILQRPREAMAGFPLDRSGRVDWVQALERGLIRPRARVGSVGKMELRTSEILMTNTREMPHVVFPHRQHTEWLACSNCHPKPFEAREGANRITMDAIFRGEFCGVCHERVAFSTFACERCHSVPHPGSPARWW